MESVNLYSENQKNNSAENALYFFHLMGLHPELAYHEIIAIFEGEFFPYKIIKKQNQCLVLSCSKKGALYAASRSAYCKRSAKLLYQSNNNYLVINQITQSISKNVDFTQLLKTGQSFLVRVYKIGYTFKDLKSNEIESAIGQEISRQTNNKNRVNINNPDIVFILLFTDSEFLFGEEIYTKTENIFKNRLTINRPFFQPGTLEPRFARLMVNLAHACSNDILIDPFCGSGGILIEAALINCKVIGLDIDKKMIIGARKNLSYFSPKSLYDVIWGDAKNLPFINKINSIATDPPYGRAASLHGKEIVKLLRDFFEEATKVLAIKGVLAISMSAEIPLIEIVENYSSLKLKVLEKMYIHKSLSRNIGVFEKV